MEHKVPELLHCPECGLRLGKAEWQACNFDYRICQDRHLWDISTGLVSGVNFTRVPIMTCWCGEETPETHMREIDKRRMCRKCFDQEADAWRMDSQESFARLDITPILTLDGASYTIETTIRIRPYPNPWSYGGMFGFGSAKGEDDLAKAIKTFHEYAEGFKGKGLVKIEVVRHDQKTMATQRKLSQPEKQEPKSETKQLSLI